jgi:hypothetical protein
MEGDSVLLSGAQQVALLKREGVKFCQMSEEAAAAFLERACPYYLVAKYGVLFERYAAGPNAGKFIALDFAQLHKLVELDILFCRALRHITLDIEFFFKLQLLSYLRLKGVGADGIAEAYLGSLVEPYRSGIRSQLLVSMDNSFNAARIERLPEPLSATLLLDNCSFGTLVDFTRYVARLWRDRTLLNEHYNLKDAKAMRNHVAHGDPVLPGFASFCGKKRDSNCEVKKALARAGFSESLRNKWMKRPAIRMAATSLILYEQVVHEVDSRAYTKLQLDGLFNKVRASSDLLAVSGPGSTVWRGFAFLERLTYSLELI